MTPLLDALLALLSLWAKVFPQQRTLERAVRLALGQVLAPGSRTISRIIAACGLDQEDWSADYRVFPAAPGSSAIFSIRSWSKARAILRGAII